MVYYDQWRIERDFKTKKLVVRRSRINLDREPQKSYEPNPWLDTVINFPRNSKKDYRRKLIMHVIKKAREESDRAQKLIEELEELL